MARLCDVCFKTLKDIRDDSEYVRMFTLNVSGVSPLKKKTNKSVTLYLYTNNATNGESIDLCPACLNNCLMNIVMSGVNDEQEEETEEGT